MLAEPTQEGLNGFHSWHRIGIPAWPPAEEIASTSVPLKFLEAPALSTLADLETPSPFAFPTWQTTVVFVYLCGVILLLVRAGYGFVRLGRLHARTIPAPLWVREILADLAGTPADDTDLRVSQDIALPVAYGWWRGVIVLPAQAMAQVPASPRRPWLATSSK